MLKPPDSTPASVFEAFYFVSPFFPSSLAALPPKDQPQDPSTDPVNQQHRDDENPGQFQHGHLVALSRHARQSARGSANARAHVAKHLVGIVQGLLGTGIVVDIQRDVFEGRGLLGQG